MFVKRIKSILGDEKDKISNMANMSAYFMQNIENINWVGFYIAHGDILKLGPFQGKPACNNIPKGKGVCGTCFLEEKAIVVKNVHEFEGHIACDENSKSELVIPVFIKDKFYGLLDVDSPIYNRFDDDLYEKILLVLNLIFETKNEILYK